MRATFALLVGVLPLLTSTTSVPRQKTQDQHIVDLISSTSIPHQNQHIVGPTSTTTLFDSPAYGQISYLIETYNKGISEKWLLYQDRFISHTCFGCDTEHISSILNYSTLGPLESPTDPESLDRDHIRGVYIAPQSHQIVKLEIVVDVEKYGWPITRLDIRTFDARMGKVEDEEMTEHGRQLVIRDVARKIGDKYFLPVEGAEVANTLAQAYAEGYFEAVSESKLAAKLMWHLRTATNDPRLRVVYEPPQVECKSCQGNQGKKSDEWQHFEDIKEKQFGFGEINITEPWKPTAPRIAYLPIHYLVSLDNDTIRQAVAERMSSVSKADVFIIDLRQSTGDDEETVAFILSFFHFDGQDEDGSTCLMRYFNRDETLLRSPSTLPLSKLPAGSKVSTIPKWIYVLISPQTQGTALQLAYHLQAFLSAGVIGDGIRRSAGNIFPTIKRERLCEGEEGIGNGRWFLEVPDLTAVHAKTGRRWWWGEGIKGNVVAGNGVLGEFADALKVAEELARELETGPRGNVWGGAREDVAGEANSDNEIEKPEL